ncbi:MAG: hypothetical protein BV456_01790 [Thermoplasmata archaeon M8B2D]|nr:MAG: hypothetical protein BV456_01790 [Thermoplasmata archaeon M8B2D]
MKIKTHLTKNSEGDFIIKTIIHNGRSKTIRYFSAEELEVSNEELPYVDFRSKILKILGVKNE